MKKLNLALVLGVAVSVSGCSDSSSSVGAVTPPVDIQLADLTLAFYNNLTTSSTASNIIVDFTLGLATPLITNVHYDKNSVKLNLNTIVAANVSEVIVNVTNSDTLASLASTSASVEPGQYYTVVALGDVENSTTDAVTFKQDRTAPASSQSNIRFIHSLSNLNTTPLNVSVNGGAILSDLDFKQASVYSSITAPASVGGTVTFDLVQSGTVIGSGDCFIRQDTNYEAIIAYADFDLDTPTIFCHPQ